MIAPLALIQVRTSDEDLRGLLTCGHWGAWTFPQSSTWDFPMDEQSCPTCGDARYFDLRLQVALLNEQEIPAEQVQS